MKQTIFIILISTMLMSCGDKKRTTTTTTMITLPSAIEFSAVEVTGEIPKRKLNIEERDTTWKKETTKTSVSTVLLASMAKNGQCENTHYLNGRFYDNDTNEKS